MEEKRELSTYTKSWKGPHQKKKGNKKVRQSPGPNSESAQPYAT